MRITFAMGQPLRGLARLLGSLCVMAALSPAHALEASEVAVKAAFLFKFGFFVEWPNTAFASGDSPITLCIVGGDPFGSVLDDAVKGQKIGNRPVVVRRLNAVSRGSGCHIVYLAETGDASLPQTLAALRGSDVLTVTDASDDGNDVGIINFVVKDNHVRFDIDDAAAASGGLVISSRLLSVALDVKPRD
jgi:YfiR/HmsC-like